MRFRSGQLCVDHLAWSHVLFVSIFNLVLKGASRASIFCETLLIGMAIGPVSVSE